MVTINFNERNLDLLTFAEVNDKNKLVKHYVAIPHGKNRIDFLRFNIEREVVPIIRLEYEYNSTAFVIISTDTERLIYFKGELLAKIDFPENYIKQRIIPTQKNNKTV